MNQTPLQPPGPAPGAGATVTWPSSPISPGGAGLPLIPALVTSFLMHRPRLR